MKLPSIAEYCNKPQTGLLILRVMAGLTMILHGIPKFIGGADVLTKVGSAISMYGVNFNPLFWGILAAAVETVGGLMIVLGMAFRPAAFLLFFVLLTAFLSMHPTFNLFKFGDIAHPWIMMWIFVGLFFTGPGEYSISK
ncbi:MAG: DoxX family protein [Opitutales bacterium]